MDTVSIPTWIRNTLLFVVRTPMACFEPSITVQISPSAGAKTVSFVGMIPTPSPNTFSEKIPSFTSSIAITFPSTTALTGTFAVSSIVNADSASSSSSPCGTPFVLL